MAPHSSRNVYTWCINCAVNHHPIIPHVPFANHCQGLLKYYNAMTPTTYKTSVLPRLPTSCMRKKLFRELIAYL